MLQYLKYNLGQIYYNRRVMYIFPELEVACFLLPKTGSTSVKKAFAQKLGYHQEGLDPHDVLRPYMVTLEKFRDCSYQKFSIVRHPMDRIRSCYKHVYIRNKSDWKWMRFQRFPSTILFHKHISFNEFVQKICTLPDLTKDQHFQLHYNQLYSQGKCLVDHIYQIENISVDRNNIQKEYNIDLGELDSINKNPTTSSDIDLSLTSETLKRFEKIYSLDYTTFDYSFS